ncbi:unnamed protein product [Mytilus coruscus]|uniref:Uncharacterized protein n=1 Tax=Mytilus coruscus TaxID=42192 RepID=A0A6J8DAU8_MYTCO|nr:unnamed protein product [Mytilus coruscus]
MSRQVLPPAGHPTGSAPQQTAEVLENRLTAAEDETNILLEQLNGLGFSKTSADINSSNMKVPVSPYKVRMASNDVLKDNYEALVSRVCKMESTVQTMKLNLLNIQGENHLKGKSNDEFEYRMNVLKQTYEQTISKYKREMEQMKEDLLQENEEKNKLKSNIKDLKSALEDSSTTRAEATVTADELSLTKQKMQRRINELKEECDREKSLRKSLEESHNTLMERVRDMEALVESERKEVKSLSMDCQSLRNDALNVREELKQTQAQRDSMERDYNEAFMKKWYDDLIKQLEQTQVIVDQQKTTNKDLKEQNEHLTLNGIVFRAWLQCSVWRRPMVSVPNCPSAPIRWKAEATVTADELSLTKQKMQRRINELKEECDREKSLRKSLEESHNTLMERVRDMEALVESERKEVKSLSMDCQSLRNDALNVREELKQTQAQRDSMERDYNEAYEEMERMKRNFETMDSDRQVLMKELDRLRKQYDDLIKQLEQTQVIVDQQKTTNKDLKEQNEHLTKLTTCVQSETEHIKSLHKKELEAERSRVAEKERIEEEALQYKIKTKELTAERESLEKRLRHVEQEYTGLNKKFVAKDDEYCQAASGLEKELNSLRHQLQVVKKEKERAVKDKDHLLDEVNQTVDSMIEERSKLQGEAQQLKIELDSQKKLRKSLEHENATLMERVSGFEGQQETQSKVEKTMMEMMEQKNKLAYENGSLQTQVTHLTAEVDKLKNAQNDATKLKHINEGLQNRYDKTQKEMSDLKIKTQRLDSQLRQKHGSYETKEKDYNELQKQRDEAVKERDTLILQIQDMEDKDQSKEYVMEWLDMSKELKSEIEDLENLRDEYVKRNTDQGEMINTFMNQIASLQVELKQLAQNQAETNLLIQQREVELEKERTVSHENKRKYEHTVKQKDDIDRMRRETENRLKEAQDESSEISVHLQDAHDWFRNKFEKLQNELVTSKRKQEDLVQDTEEQKRKADEEKLKAHAAVEKS